MPRGVKKDQGRTEGCLQRTVKGRKSCSCKRKKGICCCCKKGIKRKSSQDFKSNTGIWKNSRRDSGHA